MDDANDRQSERLMALMRRDQARAMRLQECEKRQRTVIEALMAGCAATAKEKGWDDTERPFTESIALIHSEASEALEEYRNGKGFGLIYHTPVYAKEPPRRWWQLWRRPKVVGWKPEGIAAEYADILIRVFHDAHLRGIPLAQALQDKMKFNATRPYRHGGKVC
jgi:NTP pyrophosphatase (non-canonical NTP hydrolase)